jgi:hypothetical protein
MRLKCLVCLLLASLTFGQAPTPMTPAAGAKPEQNAPATGQAPAGQPPAATDKAPEAKAPEVGPNDTVITIKGYCPGSSEQGDACKTLITRAQLDKLADALQPNMSPAIRRQLATRYAWALKMSAEAEKRGLDKQPPFEEKMRWARMQILSQELSSALQADSAKVTDADVEDYYKKNEATYEQATLVRIFIPKNKQITPATTATAATKTGNAATKTGTTTATKASTTATASAPAQPTEAQKKAGEEAMKKLATGLRERAVQGEDPDKLQKAAYAAAGLPGAPSTKLDKQRRNNLPPTHQAVMDLKVDEVSEVITDANSGYYIYKMVGKETLSLEAATPEIRKLLSSQRYREAMQSYQSNVDLNDAYFGPAHAPGMPMPPRGQMPPPQHSPDHAPDND